MSIYRTAQRQAAGLGQELLELAGPIGLSACLGFAFMGRLRGHIIGPESSFKIPAAPLR